MADEATTPQGAAEARLDADARGARQTPEGAARPDGAPQAGPGVTPDAAGAEASHEPSEAAGRKPREAAADPAAAPGAAAAAGTSAPPAAAEPAPAPKQEPKPETEEQRREQAIKATAPGTALRHALDMILAGHLGALICIGDTDNVLAAGNDGFKLDISFTANRLFELSKMDGAIVVDKGLTRILRANYHLNPDPSLPTSETGMRHRTAARMSLLTKATVISVSERRQVVTVYIDGRGRQLRSVPEIMSLVSQLLTSMQSSRSTLDRALLRLTTLELDDYVTLGDVTSILYLFEVLMTESRQLKKLVLELGSEGKTVDMQREEFIGNMDEEYTLLIRDYAADSSVENARRIREVLRNTDTASLRSPKTVAKVLGYEDRGEESTLTPLGLRTLSNVSVVRKGMADKLVNEFGSLQELLDQIEQNPGRLDRLGVENPGILADSLYRMWGKRA